MSVQPRVGAPVSQPSSPCPHCQTPVAPDASAAPYCCAGCRVAWDLLHDEGLTRFYDLACGVANPGSDEVGSLTWLGPLLQRARVASAASSNGDGQLTLTLDVQGIHCAGCVWLLRALFERRAGGHHLAINPGVGRLELVFDPDAFDLEAFLGDLARLGYRTGPALKATRAESDGLAVRLGVTVALAMNAMVLAAATYLGLDAADEPGLHALFGWLNLALATAAVLVGGPVFFRGAVAALARRSLHLDVPIALGLALAWGGSTWLFFTAGPDAAYFDTVAIFIALMLLGRFLQTRFVERNRRMLLADSGLSGVVVRTLDPDGAVALTPVDSVVCGARLLVTPGELVPVAARVVGAPADFSLAWITGESDPVTFAPAPPSATPTAATHDSALVPAGAHLVGGVARELVAAEAFAESALHTLLAPRSDDPARDRFWHRVSTVYVAAVLAAAALALLAWWPTSPARAFEVAIAVLVITCPCAIGLATPLAYELVHARLRRRGLFVREPGLLDRLRRVRAVFFDKTGTLTLGDLHLTDPAALAALSPDARSALFQMTARSNHPKSRALFAALSRGPAEPLDPAAAVTERPGVGLTLRRPDAVWRLTAAPDADAAGERALLLERLAPGAPADADGADPIASFAFAETLRPGVVAEVAALRARGLDVWLLSGDAEARVCAAARALGLPADRARAAASPADKAAHIHAHAPDAGLMIGDGVNDAPAFEAALCAGTPAIDRPSLPARADFYLMSGGVGPLTEALDLAHRLRRAITRNIAFALAYNLGGVALALAGLISPLVCAVAMPLSSLSVLGLTLVNLRPRRPAAASRRVAPGPAPAAPTAEVPA